MVNFVCSSCGAFLKKSKLGGHLTYKCTAAQSVKCFDCSKEFGRDDYSSHYTCKSENKKNGPLSNAGKKTKGQIQQEVIKRIFESVSAEIIKKDPSLKQTLEKLLSHENVPEKEKQFRNFVGTYDIPESKLELILSIFIPACNKSRETELNIDTENKKTKEDCEVKKSENPLSEQDSNENASKERRNKRERNEERQMIQSKKSEKDEKNSEKESDIEDDEKCKSGKSKTSKKRKLEDEGEESESTSHKKKKKKSKKNREASVNGLENGHYDALNGNAEESVIENGCDGRLNATLIEETPVPFKWKMSIRQTLESGPKEGMKLKKLQKKVLARYLFAGGENGNVLPKDELKSVFKKKILNEKFLVENEFISLRNID